MNTSVNEITMDLPGNNNSLYIFRPSPRLKLLYLTYLFFVVWIFIMPCLMFISILYPPTISLPFSIAALLFVLLALAWIRKYYGSIRYHFISGKIVRYRGVLVKNEICIHCHQIHRISTRRGTFQRLLGFSTVDLLTTDPRAPSGSSILLSVNGVVNPADLEKRIDSCRTGSVM